MKRRELTRIKGCFSGSVRNKIQEKIWSKTNGCFLGATLHYKVRRGKEILEFYYKQWVYFAIYNFDIKEKLILNYFYCVTLYANELLHRVFPLVFAKLGRLSWAAIAFHHHHFHSG